MRAERTALAKILIPFNYLWQRHREVNIKRGLPRCELRVTGCALRVVPVWRFDSSAFLIMPIESNSRYLGLFTKTAHCSHERIGEKLKRSNFLLKKLDYDVC